MSPCLPTGQSPPTDHPHPCLSAWHLRYSCTFHLSRIHPACTLTVVGGLDVLDTGKYPLKAGTSLAVIVNVAMTTCESHRSFTRSGSSVFDPPIKLNARAISRAYIPCGHDLLSEAGERGGMYTDPVDHRLSRSSSGPADDASGGGRGWIGDGHSEDGK